jgi:hypothetical protein
MDLWHNFRRIAVQLKPVKSSVLAFVGYDHEKQELQVVFKKGSVYLFREVPRSVYQDLMAAESIGAFFLKNVKGRFEWTKL